MAPCCLLLSHASTDVRSQHAASRKVPQAYPGTHLVPAIQAGQLRCPSRAPRLDQPGSTAASQPGRRGIAAAACDGSQLGWHGGFASQYSLGPVLGAGSFGTVHEAVNRQTGHKVAVKLLRKSATSPHGAQLDAIQAEVASWQQALASKYVAKLEGLYEDDEHAYIVQELCAGGDLREYLAEHGTCSELQTATIMRGVLDMLAECHRRSIIYGDLKPANIMFVSQGCAQQPRAVDFGCSRVREHTMPARGSPLYMAPEMKPGGSRYGVGVDVWSAGVMMFQCLTGRLPFWSNKRLCDIAKLPQWDLRAAVCCNLIEYDDPVFRDMPEAQELLRCMLERDPAARISAEAALAHPWFAKMLAAEEPAAPQQRPLANNVVEWPGSPRAVPLSPGRGASSGAGALSPLPVSPLRRQRSAELPASALLPGAARTPALPSLVPAAE